MTERARDKKKFKATSLAPVIFHIKAPIGVLYQNRLDHSGWMTEPKQKRIFLK